MTCGEQGGVAHGALGSCEPADCREDRGVADDRGAYGVPLVLIGVEQCFVRPVLGHQGEFPGQIRCILNPRVHPLGADWAVNVGGIAGEQDPTVAVVRHLCMVDLEIGEPVRIAHLDQPTHSGVRQRPDLLQGRGLHPRLGCVDEEHDPGAAVRQRKQEAHAVGMKERSDGVRRQ